MAVMAGVLDETRRRTLEALCDTIVPSVPYDGDDETVRACPNLQDAQVVAYFLHLRVRKP